MARRGVRFVLTAAACLATAPAGAQEIGAQEIDGPTTETLKEALAEAYQSNPTLLAARANLRATAVSTTCSG